MDEQPGLINHEHQITAEEHPETTRITCTCGWTAESPDETKLVRQAESHIDTAPASNEAGWLVQRLAGHQKRFGVAEAEKTKTRLW